MRRPSPLPPPPARPRPDPSAETSATAARPAERRAAPSPPAVPFLGDDADETAPIVPLPRAHDGGAADEGEAADGDTAPLEPLFPIRDAGAPGIPDRITAADPADPGMPADLRVRDVWAAARARRKALRSEVRRFTARQRRRRMVWIGVGAALVALVLGTLGVAYSPLLAVRDVTVVGAERLDAAEVAAALSGQVGTPLPLVDSSEVKAALVAFPLVETYTLEARPPHELIVRIVERTPIGSVDSAAGHTLVDAAGVALSTTPDAPEGFPVLDIAGGVGSRAFQAAGTIFRSLPEELRAQVTKITATTANDVTLTLGETRTEVVWGNADESPLKVIALEAIMTTRPPAEVDRYDVSSPNAVVVD